jgi:hypothetical protein
VEVNGEAERKEIERLQWQLDVARERASRRQQEPRIRDLRHFYAVVMVCEFIRRCGSQA